MNDTDRDKTPVLVTTPDLAPLQQFIPYLEQIWESNWVTNNGRFHGELESALCSHLGVDNLALTCNGTTALLIALRALELEGEVITTPYSFVATSHAIVWNGLSPVFVDIDADTMNLDPARIEAAITPDTSAILPVHCYGRPCDVQAIGEIADRHGLKVIYDAAHAFDVTLDDSSVLRHGDMSILSFHATKAFNTIEGGAIVCGDDVMKERIDRLKDFGIVDETTVEALGINGKMNELQAAFGLLQLERSRDVIAKRRGIDAVYRDMLADVPGIEISDLPDSVSSNFTYFPIRVTAAFGLSRDELFRTLQAQQIYCRRYFFPLISHMPMYRDLPSARADNLPMAERVAAQVICLPIHTHMNEDTAADIARHIVAAGN